MTKKEGSKEKELVWEEMVSAKREGLNNHPLAQKKKGKKIKCEKREEKAQDDMKIDGIHCLSFIKR